MGYQNWISGIYDTGDGIFKYWECQDEIHWLQKLIMEHGLKDQLWDSEGNYRWKPKDEYEGIKRSETTDGRKVSARAEG